MKIATVDLRRLGEGVRALDETDETPQNAAKEVEPAKPAVDGVLLAYLDYALSFMTQPRATFRTYAANPPGTKVSPHLAAFLVFSLTLAGTLYNLRHRLGWPEDDGRVGATLEAIGAEAIPVVLLMLLTLIAAALEILYRLAWFINPEHRDTLSHWAGPKATLNALMGYGAFIIPLGTAAVVILELINRTAPSSWYIPSAITILGALGLAAIGYLIVALRAAHKGVHWRAFFITAGAIAFFVAIGIISGWVTLAVMVGGILLTMFTMSAIVVIVGEISARRRRRLEQEEQAA